jgi:hypothetical protein
MPSSAIPHSTPSVIASDVVSAMPKFATTAAWTCHTAEPKGTRYGKVTYTYELNRSFTCPEEDDPVSLMFTVEVPPSDAEPRDAQLRIHAVSKPSSSVSGESLVNTEFHEAPYKLPIGYTELVVHQSGVDFEGRENAEAIKSEAQRCIQALMTRSSPYFEKVTAAMRERQKGAMQEGKKGKKKEFGLWRRLRGDEN